MAYGLRKSASRSQEYTEEYVGKAKTELLDSMKVYTSDYFNQNRQVMLDTLNPKLDRIIELLEK